MMLLNMMLVNASRIWQCRAVHSVKAVSCVGGTHIAKCESACVGKEKCATNSEIVVVAAVNVSM